MKLISERVKKLLNKEAPGATLKNYRLDKTPLGNYVEIHALHDTHNLVIHAYLNKHGYKIRQITNSTRYIAKIGAAMKEALRQKAWEAQVDIAKRQDPYLPISKAATRLALLYLVNESYLPKEGKSQVEVPKENLCQFLGVTDYTLEEILYCLELNGHITKISAKPEYRINL